MILKSLKLENIRSYLNAEIKFPEGSLLLAGDIGTGKSSILLAIEFALFGIKSDLPGEALLRHGKKEGSVELKFSIGKSIIIVKRNLKRMKDAVRQDSGYVIINDKKSEGTATELKSRIIDILGYPESSITKSKDLIYRFTVYTPQEEMKQILYENKDERLNTLRKVFGIDKYKRIKENIQNYTKDLRSKKREFEALIADLEEKQQQKKERIHETDTIKMKLNDLKPGLEEAKERVEKQKQILEKYEKNIEVLNKLKRAVDVYDANIVNIFENSKKLKDDIEQLEQELVNLKKEVEEKDLLRYEDIVNEIKSKEKELGSKEEKLDEIKKKLNELDILKNKAEELKEKMTKLDICPVCKQKVTKEHIAKIIKEEALKLKEIEERSELYRKHKSTASELIQRLEKEISVLKEKEKNVEINKLKLRNLKEKSERKIRLGNQKEELKRKLEEINKKRTEIKEKVEKYKNIDERYREEKEKLNEILNKQKKIEIKVSELNKEKEMLDKLIKNLEEEISKKINVKKKINYIAQIHNWLDEYFINLMSAMEKHIMSKVYTEFNELVKEWFNMLIEDEILNIRLDDEFTPIIEQNGYETYIDNLSGGEKTAVALAYRLALNKVINDLISGIKTKDLIILDEPTDGFSSEQLDRVKEVIASLNIKQIIIVSHEPKIETFVENIVRVSKVRHESKVIYII